MGSVEEYDPAVAEATARAYDDEARATGWLGPEVAFGMVYEYLLAGQSVLDLGIGTGLSSVLFRKAGLHVHGLDIDPDMLAVCRWKGYVDLIRHDLSERPYPYEVRSFDHIVCLGVLPFLDDPRPVFTEAARILKPGGTFVFLTIDRGPEEGAEVVVATEDTKTDSAVTMYRHARREVAEWAAGSGLTLVRDVSFDVYRDRGKTTSWRAVCTVAGKELV